MYLWTQSAMKLMTLSKPAEILGKVTTAQGDVISITAEAWRGWVMNFNTEMGSRRIVDLVIEKLIYATQNGNEAVRTALGQVLTPRHPSQLYQSVLEGLLVFLILAWIWRKPRKPGIISGCFGLFYCIARIIGEQFRMPDAQIGYQALGLTRGQWLSIVFALISIAVLVWAKKREKHPPMGGWHKLP
jgi:phosphatidylglycerol:prolipoprotein diacylglycerol transferase